MSSIPGLARGRGGVPQRDLGRRLLARHVEHRLLRRARCRRAPASAGQDLPILVAAEEHHFEHRPPPRTSIGLPMPVGRRLAASAYVPDRQGRPSRRPRCWRRGWTHCRPAAPGRACPAPHAAVQPLRRVVLTCGERASVHEARVGAERARGRLDQRRAGRAERPVRVELVRRVAARAAQRREQVEQPREGGTEAHVPLSWPREPRCPITRTRAASPRRAPARPRSPSPRAPPR